MWSVISSCFRLKKVNFKAANFILSTLLDNEDTTFSNANRMTSKLEYFLKNLKNLIIAIFMVFY